MSEGLGLGTEKSTWGGYVCAGGRMSGWRWVGGVPQGAAGREE